MDTPLSSSRLHSLARRGLSRSKARALLVGATICDFTLATIVNLLDLLLCSIISVYILAIKREFHWFWKWRGSHEF